MKKIKLSLLAASLVFSLALSADATDDERGSCVPRCPEVVKFERGNCVPRCPELLFLLDTSDIMRIAMKN